MLSTWWRFSLFFLSYFTFFIVSLHTCRIFRKFVNLKDANYCSFQERHLSGPERRNGTRDTNDICRSAPPGGSIDQVTERCKPFSKGYYDISKTACIIQNVPLSWFIIFTYIEVNSGLMFFYLFIFLLFNVVKCHFYCCVIHLYFKYYWIVLS